MNAKKIKFTGYVVAVLFVFTARVQASDFAVEVVSYKGSFEASPYDDPNSVLGKPTTWIFDDWSGLTYACSLVYSAWWTDPNGNKLITTIPDGSEIVVKFDHKVADDPGNPYGIDFIVFGNTFFVGGNWVEPDEDMEQCSISYFAGAEPVMVSVAQHPNGPWYTFVDGPYGDTAFPTNAFAWDRFANDWGQELDWLRPVDPNLSLSYFEGRSVADAIDTLYEGSAGGTGFDLKGLDPNDYMELSVDPNTGRKWIQYIKVEYLVGSYYPGDIDGFSDVAGGGDYKHHVGDLNVDYNVNYKDLRLFCQYWLTNISGPSDAAVIADVNEDGIVNFRDFALVAINWMKCNQECE